MTFKLHRRQIVVASILFSLSAAVYLNWQFSPKTITSTEALNTEGNFDDLKESKFAQSNLVSNEHTEIKPQKKNYYENARENRKLAHDQSMEIMKQAIEDPTLEAKTKNCLKSEISKLTKILNQQSNIENLAKAKGFEECFVTMEGEKCVIVAPVGENGDPKTDENIAKLREIAVSQGTKNYNITIISKNVD